MSGGHVNPKPAEKEKLNPAHLIEKMKGLSHDKLKEVHDHAAAIKNAACEELDRRDKKMAMSKNPANMSEKEFEGWSRKLIEGDDNGE